MTSLGHVEGMKLISFSKYCTPHTIGTMLFTVPEIYIMKPNRALYTDIHNSAATVEGKKHVIGSPIFVPAGQQ